MSAPLKSVSFNCNCTFACSNEYVDNPQYYRKQCESTAILATYVVGIKNELDEKDTTGHKTKTNTQNLLQRL